MEQKTIQIKVRRLTEESARRVFAPVWQDKEPTGCLFGCGRIVSTSIDLVYKKEGAKLWTFLCTLPKEVLAKRWERKIKYFKAKRGSEIAWIPELTPS